MCTAKNSTLLYSVVSAVLRVQRITRTTVLIDLASLKQCGAEALQAEAGATPERMYLVSKENLFSFFPKRKADLVVAAFSLEKLKAEGRARIFREVKEWLHDSGVFIWIAELDPAEMKRELSSARFEKRRAKNIFTEGNVSVFRVSKNP